MRKFKGTIIKVTLCIILAIAVILFNRNVDSKIEGFPVPAMAKYIYDKDAADYQYEWFRFKYDLPSSYKKAISSRGWKKVFHEGAKRVYTKGDKKVVLIHHTGDNNIYLYESTKKDALKGVE